MKPKPTASLLAEFQAEAELRYPEEACGLVVKVGKKQTFVPCANSANTPLTEFRIAVDEYHRASDVGEVIAVWHSHPNKTATPSMADVIECENSELPWFINGIAYADEVGFSFTETHLLEPEGFELEYKGRPYHYGLIDCYTIMFDYYKREFGIELDRLADARETRFWEFNNPVMEESYPKLGLERVYNEEPVKGDVFLIQTGGQVANHVAIYLGNDMILHHCENRLSGESVYGGYWHKHTVAHLRHPGVEKNGINEGGI